MFSTRAKDLRKCWVAMSTLGMSTYQQSNDGRNTKNTFSLPPEADGNTKKAVMLM